MSIDIIKKSIQIGAPVGQGTGNSILYIGTDGKLRQDNANFTFNDVSGLLTVPKLKFDAIGATIQEFSIDGTLSGNSDLVVPTEKAVKTYVDAQVSTVDTLAEILANDNITGGTDISISAGDAITFATGSEEIAGIENQNLLDKIATESISGLYTFSPNGTGGITSYDINIGNTADYGIMRIGDAVIGRTSFKAGSIDLDGSVLFRNVSGPVTNGIEFIFTESGGNTARFALPTSGVGNATYNPRSMLIAGPAPADTDFVKVSYWQTNNSIFHNLACDTTLNGADLGVQNNLEVEGDIFIDSIKGSTDNTNIIITPHGTGNVTIAKELDMGANAITNVGNVDGIDVGTDVPLNTTHRSLTNNPHTVTLEQVRTANNQVSGNIDLNSNNIINLANPVNDNDSANKAYVDSLVQGIVWQEPILDQQTTPPVSPSTGDRYIVTSVATGEWTGQEDDIAEWNGSSWDFQTPAEGWAVWDETDDRQYTFNGSSWVTFGSTITHNFTSGLQGGTANEYYHLTNTQHTDLTDGGDSSLHYHSTDRARANHTGTQLASTISDFDTEVYNNTDVAANTTHRSSDGSDHSFIDQDVTTTASPTFVNATLSGKTEGSLLFAGAGGVITEDNSNLFWDDTNERLGIHTNTPETAIHIEGGVGDSADKSTIMIIRSYDNLFSGYFRFKAARGSLGSPSAVLGVDRLGYIAFEGHDGTDYQESGAIRWEAAENFSGSGWGTDACFYVTKNGTITPYCALMIENNGTLSVAGTTDYENLVTADDDIPNKKFLDDNFVASIVSVDNQIPRFDGTGGQLQGSKMTMDDNGAITIESTTSVSIDLKADSDNVTESDLPYIRFWSDGSNDRGGIGVTGITDEAPDGSVLTGAVANKLTIWGNDSIQIMADSNDTIHMEAGDLTFTSSDDIIFDCGDYLLLSSDGDTTVQCTNGNTFWGTTSVFDAIIFTNNTEKFRVQDSGAMFFSNGGGFQFGEIYAYDTDTTITVSSSGIANKVQITSFNVNSESNGDVIPDHTNNHITIGKAGKYKVDVFISAESVAGASAEFGFGLWVNNGATQKQNVHAHREFLGGGGDIGSVSMGGICNFSVNDTVEVWLYNETNTQNIVLDDITLSVTQIGS